MLREATLGNRPPERGIIAFFGYTIAAVSVFLAWTWAAGVTTDPGNFASGPALSSLLLLGVVIGVLLLGSGIVALGGSTFGAPTGSIPRPDGARTTGSSCGIARAGVFLFVFGSGLLSIGLALPIANFGISHGPLPTYISPTVLFIPYILDGAGILGLLAGTALFVVERHRHRSEVRAWWRRSGRYVTVGGVTGLVIVASLLLVPVHRSFSTQLQIYGGGAGAWGSELLPSGARVSVTWSTTPVGVVNFEVLDTSGTAVYFTNATSGTLSFIAQGVPWPFYSFYVRGASTELIQVTGAYDSPTWAWPAGEPGEPT